MNTVWWEGFASFLCKFWWFFLILLVLVITAYFTRDNWLPLLGLV